MLAILAVLSLLWPRAAVTALSSYDQRFYLGIAYDLRRHGTFTDGFSYAGGGPETIRPPGMRFSPLYPALLAATATLDPGLRAGIACVEATAGRNPACPSRAPVIRSLQFAMLAGFYWMLWIAIAHAAGSRRAGWIGLAIGLLAAPLLLLSVNTLMTETLSLVLSAAACTLAAEAVQRPRATRWRWWAASGCMLGLAILSRPAFLYLFYASVVCASVVCGIVPLLRLARVRHRLAGSLAGFVAGTALPVLPWIARNAVELHRAALSFGYASHTLVQRIAFDAMTPREYGLSFVCWLPDGSGLGRLIAGRQACDRFGWDEHPDSFYSIGNGPLMQRTLDAAGGWPHHMAYLVHHYLLAEPLRHLLVSIPLALRGMYVDHWWGVLLAPVSLWATTRAWRRRDWPVLLLSLPAWFLLAFNAVVAVNQPRYNLLLVLPFSLAGALLCERLLATRSEATLPPSVS
ncbi:hypothetical protein [Lichenicoccus sp.]|uniref:hypothetical protein n=1 Tax=Lichenicoccus sp. TaxID=2781899 RepID=UPI003D09E892